MAPPGPLLITRSTRIRGAALTCSGLLLVLTACTLPPHRGLPPGASLSPDTADQPPGVTYQPVPRVFVKGYRARFYYPRDADQLVFKAEWKHHRAPTRDFEVSIARLEPDPSPPSLPSPKGGWLEAFVVEGADWDDLITALLQDLAPPYPNQGVYLQSVMRDAVVYRNAGGNVELAPFSQKPPEVIVQHRFSRSEAMAMVATHLEQYLAAHARGESLFLLIPPQGITVTLLNLQERHCVLLDHPWQRSWEDQDSQLTYAAHSLTSLLVESHVVALLKNPFSSIARLGNLGFQSLVNLLGPQLRPPGQNPSPPIQPSPPMDLVDWETWLDQHTGTRSELASLRLLIDGEQFFPRLETALQEASQSIHLLVGIFDRDDVAVHIADLLRRRSAEIDVRVVLDRLSCLAAGVAYPSTPMPQDFHPPGSIRAYLENQSRVRVRSFLNPWMSSEHSKVMLVDATRAWVGGMNIGREYRYEWHDLMVEIEGPLVASLQRTFQKSWAHAGPLGDLAYVRAALASRPSPSASPADPAWIPVRQLPTRTAWKPLAHAVFKALQSARHHIYLENPYLFDNRVIAELVRAQKRGVDVHVILPSHNDLTGAHGSNLVTANYLWQQGVRVYFYPAMTHVKALLVDGWSCLGSANFNHLSLRLNQEVNLATSDPRFARELKSRLFDRDLERSVEMTEPLPVSWVDHLLDRILGNL